MFVVEVGAALTTVFVIKDAVTGMLAALLFGIQIALWLWFTVLFANFAEAMAEARGKAQADALRKTKTDTIAQQDSAERQVRDGAGFASCAPAMSCTAKRAISFPAMAK